MKKNTEEQIVRRRHTDRAGSQKMKNKKTESQKKTHRQSRKSEDEKQEDR